MMLRHALLVLAVAVFAGCDSNGSASGPESWRATSDTAYVRLLDDLGGVDGLARLLRESSNDELEATFARYGMAFEVVDREAAEAEWDMFGSQQDITACPQYFPTSDRTKWFRLIGAGGPEDHYIDSRGRPAIASKMLGPITTAARQTTCQTNVGNWGNPPANFDGGHLIGSQLGGWGGRANLVPQHYNFNRGNWVKIENKLAQCGRLGNSAVQFVVDIDYPNTTTLTPSAWRGDVTIGGVTRRASFTNTSGGGPNGTTQADGMVSWLHGRGCY